jgi:signal transduction histidine kinase
MKIYNQLSQIGFLKKYSYKFLFVAFIGIHIPLIGIIIFVISSQGEKLTPTSILIISLVLTLIATGVTLFFLNMLLEPLTQSKKALEAYVDQGTLPDLPTKYADEAGILMQKLQVTLFKLDELVKAKDDLITLISHDVRTPLSHMISYAELTQNAAENEKIKTYTEKIITSGKQQLNMLESILTLLRQQGVSLTEMDKEALNINALFQESLTIVQPLIQEKELKIKVDISPDLIVKGNENLLNHVVYNLIHNACKFSDKSGEIVISGNTIDGNKMQLTIKDQGIGFDSGFSEVIFDRFTKFGQKGTFGESTTGIGLYVSRRIIEKHAGTIHAKSEGKNKGAMFTIQLPK